MPPVRDPSTVSVRRDDSQGPAGGAELLAHFYLSSYTWKTPASPGVTAEVDAPWRSCSGRGRERVGEMKPLRLPLREADGILSESELNLYRAWHGVSLDLQEEVQCHHNVEKKMLQPSESIWVSHVSGAVGVFQEFKSVQSKVAFRHNFRR